jgi:hypothetical protein
MHHLIPAGFLTIREAAAELAAAKYAGLPDRPAVKQYRDQGFEVADGLALADATSEIWSAVDKSKLQAFLACPGLGIPLKLPADMSTEIPTLRSPKGGDFTFLRHRNRHHAQFAKWFGPNIRDVSVVFRAEDIKRLSRVLLRTRRRRAASSASRNVGRPSVKADVKGIIRQTIDRGKWSTAQSLKGLAGQVNRRGNLPKLVSEDTVTRALDELYNETRERQFERIAQATRRTAGTVKINFCGNCQQFCGRTSVKTIRIGPHPNGRIRISLEDSHDFL